MASDADPTAPAETPPALPPRPPARTRLERYLLYDGKHDVAASLRDLILEFAARRADSDLMTRRVSEEAAAAAAHVATLTANRTALSARINTLRYELDRVSHVRAHCLTANAFYNELERLAQAEAHEEERLAQAAAHDEKESARRAAMFATSLSTGGVAGVNQQAGAGIDGGAINGDSEAEKEAAAIATSRKERRRKARQAAEQAAYRANCVRARDMQQRRSALWEELEAAMEQRESTKHASRVSEEIAGMLEDAARNHMPGCIELLLPADADAAIAAAGADGVPPWCPVDAALEWPGGTGAAAGAPCMCWHQTPPLSAAELQELTARHEATYFPEWRKAVMLVKLQQQVNERTNLAWQRLCAFVVPLKSYYQSPVRRES